MAGNCSALDSYESFADYVRLMRHITSDKLTISSMMRCRTDICSTLYGAGNTDVSGIGVSVVEFTRAAL